MSEFQSNPPSDILAAMARTGYHSGESCEDRNYSQHTSDKGSSLTPAPSISRTGKTVLNVPSPEAEKVDSGKYVTEQQCMDVCLLFFFCLTATIQLLSMENREHGPLQRSLAESDAASAFVYCQLPLHIQTSNTFQTSR